MILELGLELRSELELESRVVAEGELLDKVEEADEVLAFRDSVELATLSSSALTLLGAVGNSKPPRISSRRRLVVPARLVNSCRPPPG